MTETGKGTRKKLAKAVWALALAGTLVCMPTQASAARPNKATVKKAYKTYVKKKLSSVAGGAAYCDVDQDGVPEMFFSYTKGNKNGLKVFTYQKGKVVSMKSQQGTGTDQVYYNKKKKQVCIVISDSDGMSATFTFYKKNGKKLKKVQEYKCIYSADGMSVNFYKNGKNISVEKYLAMRDQLTKWKGVYSTAG